MTSMNLEEMEMRVKFIGEKLNRNLRIERWSPGDGWTRYKVVDYDTSKEIFGNWRVFNKQEFEAALIAVSNVLDLVELPREIENG